MDAFAEPVIESSNKVQQIEITFSLRNHLIDCKINIKHRRCQLGITIWLNFVPNENIQF